MCCFVLGNKKNTEICFTSAFDIYFIPVPLVSKFDEILLLVCVCLQQTLTLTMTTNWGESFDISHGEIFSNITKCITLAFDFKPINKTQVRSINGQANHKYQHIH